MDCTDFPAILRDAMLLLAGKLAEGRWARLDFSEEDMLTLLPSLAATCSDWHDAVHGLTKYATLRLAVADCVQVKGRAISSSSRRQRQRDMEYMYSVYERAVFVLSRSWAVETDLEERLRCAPLAELSAADLKLLVHILEDGWVSSELKVAAGEKVKPCRGQWVSPSHRAA